MKANRKINMKKVEGVKRGELRHIDPQLLQYDEGFNIRSDYGNIEELADDIRECGVLKPLEYRNTNDGFFVTDGHRRLMAIEMLRNQGHIVEFVPCVLERKGTNEIDRDFNLLRANDGKNLTPLEMGNLFVRLMKKDSSLTPKSLAKRSHKTLQFVEKALSLVTLSEDVQEQVASGEIPTVQALALVGVTDSINEQREIAKEASKNAKSAGRKRVNTSDMVKAMENRQIPEKKIKQVKKSGKSAILKDLQTFYEDSYADYSRRQIFVGIGYAIDILNGEMKVKDLKKVLDS